MARNTQQFNPEQWKPRSPEQSRAWTHVSRVFGRQPSSVRSISETGKQADACIFKLEWSPKENLEFICAGGVLVGIPPFGKTRF